MGVAFHGLLTVLSAAWLCQDGHFAALFSLCFAPAVCQVLPHLFIKNISLPPRDAPGKRFLPKAAPAQIRRRAALPEKGGRNRRVPVSPCRKKQGEPARSQVRPAHACGRREPAAAGPCNMFSFKVTAYGFSGPWAPRRRLPQKASRCALQAGLHRRRRASRTPRRAPRNFRAQRRRQRPLPHRPAL